MFKLYFKTFLSGGDQLLKYPKFITLILSKIFLNDKFSQGQAKVVGQVLMMIPN